MICPACGQPLNLGPHGVKVHENGSPFCETNLAQDLYLLWILAAISAFDPSIRMEVMIHDQRYGE